MVPVKWFLSWLIIPNFLFLISILHGTSGCKLINSENGMTCQEKKDMLHYHNERRSHVARGLQKEKNVQSPAEDMEVMRWNADMAERAQKYADKCVFEHSQFPGEGENLAIFAGQNRTKPVDAAALWFSEVEIYGYNVGEYSDNTGHYSQMIWSNSEELGCGQSYFDKGGQFPYHSMMVCRYKPPGNYPWKAYEEGQPDCEKHHMHKSIKYEGLCSKSSPDEQKAWETCSADNSCPSLHLLLVIGFITLRKFGLL